LEKIIVAFRTVSHYLTVVEGSSLHAVLQQAFSKIHFSNNFSEGFSAFGTFL